MTTKFEFSSLAKADPQKMQLVGTIYRADKIDSQGEFMTGAELEKAAHAALANGLKIDVGHDGKALHKSHAALVESSVVDEDGGKVWKGIVQLSAQAWDQLVKSGKVAAFSIGGRAPRRSVQKDGKTVRELYDVAVEFVSLVNKGAIGEPVVQKSDGLGALVEELRTLMNKIDAQATEIEAIKAARVGKSHGSTPTVAELRKQALTEQAVRAEVELDELRARHLAKTQELETIWEGTAELFGQSRVAVEQRLCRELRQIEIEMELLGKGTGVNIVDDDRSAFHFRGGQSMTARIPHSSDNQFSANRVGKSRTTRARLPSDNFRPSSSNRVGESRPSHATLPADLTKSADDSNLGDQSWVL